MNKINFLLKSPYKKIYQIICLIYSNLVTNFEDLLLRKKFKEKNSLNIEGFLKLNTNWNINDSKKIFKFVFSESNESFFANKYHKRIILSEEVLALTIKMIFHRQFCDYLASITGFKYTIDYFGAYQNFSIPEEDLGGSWYANNYHLDKPNSGNMLKIFLPMADISIKDGPLELLTIKKTKKYLKKLQIPNFEKVYLVGALGDMYICRLNLCLHKAGVPQLNKSTKLIMLQLNPSSYWCVNSKIYNRQYYREPKFTSLVNSFVEKTPLFL